MDGSKTEQQRCGSGWVAYQWLAGGTGPELASGHCFIGCKAEVYDAELHAIQEALLYIVTAGWAPASLLICVDNQAALQTLSGGNPDGSEFARHVLSATADLKGLGWSVSGLWTPAHCGIQGNEHADTLAKAGSQLPSMTCKHSRVTKTWLQAQARQGLKTDWEKLFPPDPQFPIRPSTTFPRDLRNISPSTLRALFRLQAGTAPSDPFPNEAR